MPLYSEIYKRICTYCGVVEDEKHFIVSCVLYENERLILYRKIESTYENFQYLDEKAKFMYMFLSKDPKILGWLGKFIKESFEIRTTGRIGSGLTSAT